jgi:hypothetical protein
MMEIFMVTKWLLGNLLWPTLQSAIGAGLLALIFLGKNQAGEFVSGCPLEVTSLIAEGEQALARGDTKRALSYAEDGLVSAPKSLCSNTFAAAAELQAMRERLSVDDQDGAEEHRSRCFYFARQATPLLGKSPRVDAIGASCSASQAHSRS